MSTDGGDEGNNSRNGMTPLEHCDFYWKLIVHENSLINYRFFWGVFVNAGLLTFFTNKIVLENSLATYFVAVFGLVWSVLIAIMCSAAFRAERASLNAIEAILIHWRFPKRGFGLPRMKTLRGGGDFNRHNVAAFCGTIVFWAMPVFWLAVLLALVFKQI